MSPLFSNFRRGTLWLTLPAALTAPMAVGAQASARANDRLATIAGEPRLMGGISFDIGQPSGSFDRYVDEAFGIGAHGLYRLGRSGAIALRLDGGFLNYGHETARVALGSIGGGRLMADLTTTNNIAWLGVGPQLMAPQGAIRPYMNAIAGLSYFATTSSVEGTRGNVSFARTTSYDDTQFSWGGGAGVLVPVRRGAGVPVSLDLGARYHDNGRHVRYLREGGIHDVPNGDLQLDVIHSRADLISYHVGVSVGIR